MLAQGSLASAPPGAKQALQRGNWVVVQAWEMKSKVRSQEGAGTERREARQGGGDGSRPFALGLQELPRALLLGAGSRTHGSVSGSSGWSRHQPPSQPLRLTFLLLALLRLGIS